MFTNKRFLKFTQFILIGLFSIISIYGAAGDVDANFNPSLTKDVTSNFSGNPVLQPDGKIIVYGNFQNNSGGLTSTYIKRLNSDGTTDTSFNCAACIGFFVSSVLVQNDGKIIVGGNSSIEKIFRLNADGSLDPTFNAAFPPRPFGNSTLPVVQAIQPDGKVLVRLTYALQGTTEHDFVRFNADGSFDNTFTKIVFGASRNPIGFARLYVFSNGKILLGGTGNSGSSATGFLNRYNSDGTRDTSFESPAFTDPENRSYVNSFDVQTDGSIIISGKFTAVNSISKTDLVRLLPAGNVDPSFNSASLFNPIETFGGKVALLPNGQMLVNTVNFSAVFPVSTDNRLYRLNADGSVDNTFNPPPELTMTLNWILDGSNRVIVFGVLSGVTRYVRLNADGSLDTSFNPTISKNGTIAVLAIQPDGKIIISGEFDRINGTSKNNFSRLNADGTPDISFNSGSGFDVSPKTIAFQADGKILVGGAFTTYNGVAKMWIARLNADGSVDNSFNPVSSSSVNSISPLADGKILIGGSFATVNGISRPGLAKLNADGTTDASFNANFGTSTINSVLVQSDGKIIGGGVFSGVNGFNRQNLVRLNSDGNLDTSFNAGNIATISKIIQQPDGKYVVLQTGTIARRNSDGTVDANFQPPTINGTVNTIFLQSDGNFLIGGDFTSINNNARNNFARLSSNGSFDLLFFQIGANGSVNAISAQPDGKIVIGGNFSLIENVARSGIAKLNIQPLRVKTNFDFEGDGKADVSVFRASENKWYILQSSDFSVSQKVFAIGGDVPTPADFDGDGKTDVAIFRPSTGDWWYQSSINNAQIQFHWGQAGDIPRPGDFDGDGKSDFIVYRPSNSVWYRYGSTGAVSILAFGIAEDKPLVGDFDGDGKVDFAIFRPSTGDWWYAASSAGNQFRTGHWGANGDIPVPADYDGDGKTDLAVYRPSNNVWYIQNSGSGGFTILAFGSANDKPIAADYDGDGKADIAVFRPSTGTWYLQQTTAGFGALQFGISTDIPTENAFVP